MPSQAEYENLLESSISLVMGNITYQWMISNIIVETSEYFSSLKEIFGEFVMAFTKYPEQFNKQFCYLFNEYIYQNSYKIKYLRTNYDSSKYNISFGINNMKSDSNTSLTEIINMIAVDEPSTNVYGYLLTSLSVLLLFLFFIQALSSGLKRVTKYYLSLAISCIAPYIIFKLLYYILGEVSLFSFYSTALYLTFLFIILISLIIEHVALKSGKTLM
jgi:hypothetical protein